MTRSKNSVKNANWCLLSLLFLLFGSCAFFNKTGMSYTKQWNGSDVPGHNYASFTDLNGQQIFNILLPLKGLYYLKYSVTVNRGELIMKIKSSSKEIVNLPIIETLTDSIRINNMGNARYKLYFFAKHANGNFDISYALLKR